MTAVSSRIETPAAAIDDPETVTIRRLSIAMPHISLQPPEVSAFLASRGMPAVNTILPEAFLTKDIVAQSSLMALPLAVRRLQARHLLDMISPKHSILFVPSDHEEDHGETFNNDDILTFIDQSGLTVVSHTQMAIEHGRDNVLQKVISGQETLYDTLQNPEEVAKLEARWRTAGQLALDQEVSANAFWNMANDPAS